MDCPKKNRKQQDPVFLQAVTTTHFEHKSTTVTDTVVTNTAITDRTKTPELLLSFTVDRRHSLATSMAYRQTHVTQLTEVPPNADWKCLPGRPRRTWFQQVEDTVFCWCYSWRQLWLLVLGSDTTVQWSSAIVSEWPISPCDCCFTLNVALIWQLSCSRKQFSRWRQKSMKFIYSEEFHSSDCSMIILMWLFDQHKIDVAEIPLAHPSVFCQLPVSFCPI